MLHASKHHHSEDRYKPNETISIDNHTLASIAPTSQISKQMLMPRNQPLLALLNILQVTSSPWWNSGAEIWYSLVLQRLASLYWRQGLTLYKYKYLQLTLHVKSYVAAVLLMRREDFWWLSASQYCRYRHAHCGFRRFSFIHAGILLSRRGRPGLSFGNAHDCFNMTSASCDDIMSMRCRCSRRDAVRYNMRTWHSGVTQSQSLDRSRGAR